MQLLLVAIFLLGNLQATHGSGNFDPSLPLPISTHSLGHHRISQHETDIRKLGRRSNDREQLRGAQRSMLAEEMLPLYQGFGTHYAYLYIGTPPQRQSVIIDTGSQYTAFPCTGCSKCGDHTDNYWDPKNSSTVKILKCPGGKEGENKLMPAVAASDKVTAEVADLETVSHRRLKGDQCIVSKGYEEGSSWTAYEVTDTVWAGSTGENSMVNSKDYSVTMKFACQTEITGMFRDQLADGIMGMSRDLKTLPNLLMNNKLLDNNIFALCYRIGGGIMTLGGVDQMIHKGAITWIKTVNDNSTFFKVTILDIKILPRPISQFKNVTSIGAAPQKYLGVKNKRAILDSGTTDTYLPANIVNQFKNKFKAVSGMPFPDDPIKLSEDQLAHIPDIQFVFEGLDNKTQSVTLPWQNYVDSVGDNTYAFRLYVTEKDGTILGSNFMRGNNVIFDQLKGQVGFASSDCNSEKYITVDPPKSSTLPSLPPALKPSSSTVCQDQAYTECTAFCDKNESAYKATGTQLFTNTCDSEVEHTPQTKPCTEYCNFYQIVRVPTEAPSCPDTPWTDCNRGCMVSRQYVPTTEPLMIGTRKGEGGSKKCNYREQTQTCYTGACSYKDGDYLIIVDLRVHMSATKWSYVYVETFITAFAKLFGVKSTSVEMLNDASSFGTIKLHLQLRLKETDYEGAKKMTASQAHNNAKARMAPKTSIHNVAEGIVNGIRSNDFPDHMILMLDNVARSFDKNTSRFGWLQAYDIEVISAFALPLGTNRDYKPDGEVTGYHGETTTSNGTPWGLVFTGIGLGLVLMIVGMVCMYRRLQSEHALLEKDKGSLKEMWKKFNETTAKAANAAKAVIGGEESASLSREQYEIELSKLSLIGGMEDSTLDTGDFNR